MQILQLQIVTLSVAKLPLLQEQLCLSETAEHNDAEVVVSGCTFTNFKYGVTDNLNGKDVASVEVTDSEFTNASINVSASEKSNNHRQRS